MTHTTTDAAEARVPGHDEVPTLEQATRWLGKFSNQDEVASTTPRKIAFELAGIHSLLLSLATTEAASGAGEREATDAQLKDAVTELLGHRGEQPHRVLRGGQELWETWLPAFRAAMRYLPAASLPPATDPAIPAGWKLVPVEPTSEQIDAGVDGNPTNWTDDTDDLFAYDVANDVYRAMVAAAPTIPATGEAVPDRFANDAAAKALYDSWSDMPGWVPWVERGNSDMQERARREVSL